MTVIIRQITAVLNMPDDYLEQGQHANDIITASTASASVTVPPAIITASKTALTAFQNAETYAARNAALRPLRQALQGIMSFFQVAANADPANAEVIIESGGFKVKHFVPRHKQDFELSNGLISGTINLDAEGAGQHAFHDWMYSPDGITFTRMVPTLNAHTHMDGLTVGQWAYFTHEVITKDGGQGVSQVEKIMVK
jgi:hypothetical protein